MTRAQRQRQATAGSISLIVATLLFAASLIYFDAQMYFHHNPTMTINDWLYGEVKQENNCK